MNKRVELISYIFVVFSAEFFSAFSAEFDWLKRFLTLGARGMGL
jgi:hypothetical protein